MAGGKTVPSQKRKPSHEKKPNLNKVATGKGVPVASDGSGSNKRAALDSPGIKKGKQPHVASKLNSGKDSPIGKTRPTQDGGPRTGHTKGVDWSISDKHPTAKDYGWSV